MYMAEVRVRVRNLAKAHPKTHTCVCVCNWNFGKTHMCVRCACGRKSSVRMCVRARQKFVATHCAISSLPEFFIDNLKLPVCVRGITSLDLEFTNVLEKV